jgi:hypothetical protein
MTRLEFIAKRDKLRKLALICGLVGLVGFIAPVCFMSWLEPRREDLPAHLWSVLNFAALAIWFVGMTAFFIIQWRLTKRAGHCCPACKKSVIEMSSVVIATGRCGHCGAKVLDDAD